MATAVLDLELKSRHCGVAVPARYSRAVILLRWNGRPVGQLLLPVTDGRIDEFSLEQALARWAGADFWWVWLHDSLGWDESEARTLVPRATVAVCTRNRPAELRRCLDAISALPDQDQDIIVVDNRPSDGASAEVV